jgi:hypothetical protein
MNFIVFFKSVINMKNRIKLERHEYTYGPHFNESCAKEAVANMQNEDGTTGAHWSLDETT